MTDVLMPTGELTGQQKSSAHPKAHLMSISSVSTAGASTGTDSTLAAQLRQDQQKLQRDTQAKASATQLAADKAAITKDQQAITQASGSGTDSYA